MPLATMGNAAIPALLAKRTFDAIPADATGHAAGVLFVAPDGDVLLCRRSNTEENYGGHWALPGGKAEDGESPAKAAARESVEELGGSLDPSGLKLLDRKSTPTGMVFHTFARPVERKFQPRINDEHSGYSWFPLDALPSPLHPGVAATLKDRLGIGANDMSPEDWEGLRSGFLRWTLEEEAETEHANDQEQNQVELDAEHDGPWMSVMAKGGAKWYRNRNVPDRAEIDGKTYSVDPLLEAHETKEYAELVRLVAEFERENKRKPDEKERKELYLKAHRSAGVPAEKAKAKEMGVPWEPWNAWCRGIEAKVEEGPFENEPEDADVKPIPHGHGDLEEALDADLELADALLGIPFPGAGDRMAMDRSMRSFDDDGHMHVELTNISKANICPYKGREIPGWDEETGKHALGLDPDETYMLLRDPAELKKSVASWNGKPLLYIHEPSSAEDHPVQETIGSVQDISFADPYLRAGLTIWRQEGIDLIESGAQREISCGYRYDPDMTPGTFGGEKFDGIMRNIRGNHVAIVEEGRAGPDVMVADSLVEYQWDLVAEALIRGWENVL